MPTTPPLSLNSIITVEGYAAAANNVADANGFKINLTKVQPVVNGMPQGDFPAVGVALGNGQVRIRATIDSVGTEYGFDEVWIYDGNSNVVFCKVKRSDGGILDYVSPYKSSVINYTIRFTTLPAGTVTIVADSGQSLALAALDAHIEDNNPHPNAPYARYHDLNLSHNMIRNGGMEIWQERSLYNIPADSAAHVADGYVLHSYSGSSLVSKGDWGTRTPRLVSPIRDADLPLDIAAYLRWQYTPVAGANLYLNMHNGALQNRSFNVKRWAGQRVIVSMWVCLESYAGVENTLAMVGTAAEIKKKIRIGIQQYFGENQTTRTTYVNDDSQVIDGKWKQIHAVLDIPMIDAAKTIDNNISFSSPYMELSSEFEKGKAFTLVTTAWRVEPCLYPVDYPRHKIKPSPWQATPFALDLAECQRYYEKSYPANIAVGTVWIDKDECVAPQAYAGSNWHAANIQFKSEKVRIPSFAIYNASTGQAGNARHFGDTFNANAPTYNLAGVELGHKGVPIVGIHTPTAVNAALEFHWVADSRI